MIELLTPLITDTAPSRADVDTPVITVQVSTPKQPYNLAVDLLDSAFTFFNTQLFNNSISVRPVITIQSKGRKNAYGWFWAGKWKNGIDNRCEINISAEELARTATSIFETLIHEMVHQFNWQRGIFDCTANQYHNKRFRLGCEEAGLNCEKLRNYGWAKTSLAGKSKIAVNEFIANNDCKMFDSFKRIEKRREYRQVWTIPVSQEDKEWIERRAQLTGLSQKALITQMITHMPAHVSQ